MATRTVTKGDLSVTTTSRIDQANLLVSILNGPSGERGADGMDVLMSYPKPPTFEQFDKDHPRGSEGARNVRALLMTGEAVATFVKQGILDQDLVFDLLWISGSWARVKNIALHFRKEAGDPAIYENYEALAKLQG
jgi:hypothetical protein